MPNTDCRFLYIIIYLKYVKSLLPVIAARLAELPAAVTVFLESPLRERPVAHGAALVLFAGLYCWPPSHPTSRKTRPTIASHTGRSDVISSGAISIAAAKMMQRNPRKSGMEPACADGDHFLGDMLAV